MTTNNVPASTRPAPSKPKRAKRRRSRTAPAPVRRRRTHLVAEHPLAEAVRHRCLQLDHRADAGRYIGKVGCDECWEAAIRADERFAVENDLDDADPVPADDLDEIALGKAMRGERVRLTGHERAAAIGRLAEAGLSAGQIAYRLHLAGRDVQALLEAAAAVAAESVPQRPSAALAA